MEHEHTPEAIRARLAEGPRPSYLRDWVYGGIDGSVTTFAVVTGVVGAHLSPAVILILGIANLLGDGFSMAASNFLGTRTERQEAEALLERERRHIAVHPEGEREEVRQIFAAKGLEGPELERVVDVVTADEDRWIAFMLSEEYGLPQQVRSAAKAALSTFGSFLACGLVPLLPFVLGAPRPFAVSMATTLAIGAIAAGLAYGAGVVIGRAL